MLEINIKKKWNNEERFVNDGFALYAYLISDVYTQHNTI